MAYSDPVRTAIAITPSDSVDIRAGQLTRGIYVGGPGNISVVMDNGSVTFVGALAGVFYPIRISRVNATGTTATNLLALY